MVSNLWPGLCRKRLHASRRGSLIAGCDWKTGATAVAMSGCFLAKSWCLYCFSEFLERPPKSVEMVCSCLSLVLHTFSGGGTLFQSTIGWWLIICAGLKFWLQPIGTRRASWRSFSEISGRNQLSTTPHRPIKSLDCWCGDVLHAQLVTSFRWCKGWRGLGRSGQNLWMWQAPTKMAAWCHQSYMKHSNHRKTSLTITCLSNPPAASTV